MHPYPQAEPISPKNWLTTLLLSIFLGGLGAHRFYTGKPGTAILMIFTCSGLGVWALIDLITIIVGNFKDSDGLPVKNQ